MGEIRPTKCEGRELTKDQLQAGPGDGRAGALVGQRRLPGAAPLRSQRRDPQLLLCAPHRFGAAKLAPLATRPDRGAGWLAQVEKLLFEGDRAVGVLLSHDTDGSPAHEVKVKDGGEVLVCTGAVQSPALLQRSGVGPAALLGSLGIPVVKANDAVGMSMQDHPTICAQRPPPPPTIPSQPRTRLERFAV